MGTTWQNVSRVAGFTTELEYELTELTDRDLVFVGRNKGATSRDGSRTDGEGGTRRRNGNGLAVDVRVRVRVRLVSSEQHQAHPDPHSDHLAPGDLQHAVGPVAKERHSLVRLKR